MMNEAKSQRGKKKSWPAKTTLLDLICLTLENTTDYVSGVYPDFHLYVYPWNSKILVISLQVII